MNKTDVWNVIMKKIHIIKILYNLFGIKSTIYIIISRMLNVKSTIAVEYKEKYFNVRPCESDIHVACQIFWKREYEIPRIQRDAINKICKELKAQDIQPIIIDAGANVGYAAIYLSNEFPDARIISIEPDPETFEVLKLNCRDLKNVFPVHGALWKHNQGVKLDNKDAPSWGRTVQDNGIIPSFTLAEVIKSTAESQIVLLKVDIEGAEYDVFKSSSEITKHIPCIIIEPHDWLMPGRSSLSPLFQAISDKAVDTIINGENLILFDSQLCNSEDIQAVTVTPSEVADVSRRIA